MLPFTETATAEVDISRMANKLTPPDALFLVAPELTDFRWYSQRSSFVDYKAMLHTEEFLFDWYDRIDLAYEYNDSVKQSGTSIYQQAKTLFNMPDAQLMDKWRALGITHLITYGDSIPHIPVLARNGSYALYRIK